MGYGQDSDNGRPASGIWIGTAHLHVRCGSILVPWGALVAFSLYRRSDAVVAVSPSLRRGWSNGSSSHPGLRNRLRRVRCPPGFHFLPGIDRHAALEPLVPAGGIPGWRLDKRLRGDALEPRGRRRRGVALCILVRKSSTTLRGRFRSRMNFKREVFDAR